jgi:hypothetical protein
LKTSSPLISSASPIRSRRSAISRFFADAIALPAL